MCGEALLKIGEKRLPAMATGETRAGGTAGACAGCTARTSQILEQDRKRDVDVDSVGENLVNNRIALSRDTRAAPPGRLW